MRFPDFIERLPQGEAPAKAAQLFVLQAEKHQVGFIRMEEDLAVPELAQVDRVPQRLRRGVLHVRGVDVGRVAVPDEAAPSLEVAEVGGSLPDLHDVFPNGITRTAVGQAVLVPLDRILVETDAPYLAPVPHRGGRNEPCRVVDIVAALARIRGTDPETLASAVASNYRQLFAP